MVLLDRLKALVLELQHVPAVHCDKVKTLCWNKMKLTGDGAEVKWVAGMRSHCFCFSIPSFQTETECGLKN